MFSTCETKKPQLLSSVLKQSFQKFSPLVAQISADPHPHYGNTLEGGVCMVGPFLTCLFLISFLGVQY